MKKIDNQSKKRNGVTLIEAVIAMWVLFAAICCIFEVLKISSTQMAKTKKLSQLVTLSSSQLEQIIYSNDVSSLPGNWTSFPGNSDFRYRIVTENMNLYDIFPDYVATKVTLYSQPSQAPFMPKLSLCTILLSNSQSVTLIEDGTWGTELLKEADI